MNAHITVDHLSSYLDDELSRDDSSRVEDHLHQCSQCRHRLEGLQSVVHRLAGLEGMAPPAALGGQLESRLAGAAEQNSFRHRADVWRDRAREPFHLVGLSLALVIALVLIVYLFAIGVQRSADRAAVGALATAENDPGARLLRAGQSLGDRRFEWLDERWVEDGEQRRTPDRVLSASSAEDRAWLQERIDLEALEALGGPIVVRLDGQLVAIEWDR